MSEARVRRSEVAGWVLLVLSAFAVAGGRLSSVRFEEERIEVTVGDGAIDVDGRYDYRNVGWWPVALRLEIPFPVDDDHSQPRGLAVDEVDETGALLRPVWPQVSGGRVFVRLVVPPRARRRLWVRYSQDSEARWGRYLLTTTRAWGRPIERAALGLRARPGSCVAWSSLPLEARPSAHGGADFRTVRRRFWPRTDWRFGWLTGGCGDAA